MLFFFLTFLLAVYFIPLAECFPNSAEKKRKKKREKKGKLETKEELKCFSCEVEIDKISLRREEKKEKC